MLAFVPLSFLYYLLVDLFNYFLFFLLFFSRPKPTMGDETAKRLSSTGQSAPVRGKGMKRKGADGEKEHEGSNPPWATRLLTASEVWSNRTRSSAGRDALVDDRFKRLGPLGPPLPPCPTAYTVRPAILLQIQVAPIRGPCRHLVCRARPTLNPINSA